MNSVTTSREDMRTAEPAPSVHALGRGVTMLARLRIEANKHLRHLGFQLERFSESTDGRRMKMIHHHGIQTVIDVGANVGDYGIELRNAGYTGHIVSFEPTAMAFDVLATRTGSDPLWTAIKAAVGSEEGEIAINVAGNGAASSSILPMREDHLRYAPDTRYIAKEAVPLKTLDSALCSVLAPDARALLKIDAQGYEEMVLRGAARVLRQVELIECELSFLRLYDGQLLFTEMLDLLKSLGYGPVQFSPGFTDATTGHNLQVDGIFSRSL